MRSILRAALALPLGALALAFARPAAAEQAQDFVNIGAMTGFTAHLRDEIDSVLGVEGTFTHYTDESLTWGVGAFAQVQGVGFDHVRAALGAQANFLVFGLELGPFIEQGSAPFGTTVGVQACPFVSFGYASLALRVGIPLGAVSSGGPYPLDLGMVATVKWVLPIGGKLLAVKF